MVITCIFISAVIYLVLVQGPIFLNLVLGVGGIVGLFLSILSFIISPKERVEAPSVFKFERVLRKGEYVTPQLLRDDPAWIDFEHDYFFPHPQIPQLTQLLETPWVTKRSAAKSGGRQRNGGKAPHLYITGPSGSGKTILMKQLGFTFAQKRQGLLQQPRQVYFVDFKTLPPESTLAAPGIDRLLDAIEQQDNRYQYLLLDDVHLNPRLANTIMTHSAGLKTAVICTGRFRFQDNYPASDTEFLQKDRLTQVVLEPNRTHIQHLLNWFTERTKLDPALQPQLDVIQRECGGDLWLLGQLLLAGHLTT